MSQQLPGPSDLTIQIWRQENGYIAAMIECPAFVDQSDLFHDADEALEWAIFRCRTAGDLLAENAS